MQTVPVCTKVCSVCYEILDGTEAESQSDQRMDEMCVTHPLMPILFTLGHNGSLVAIQGRLRDNELRTMTMSSCITGREQRETGTSRDWS